LSGSTATPATARNATIGRVGLIVLILFLLLSVLHLHGFSLPIWHDVIDGSAPGEILYGKARAVRADDWAVALPTILSQSAQSPRFPVVNELVGDGTASNLVGYSVPMVHWLTLFRPHLWGYFVGRDFGLAWHWWFRALFLFYSWFLVFLILSRNRVRLSVFAGISLVFAPFFQYWAMNYEPMTGMLGICVVACHGLLFTESRTRMVLHGLLLAWAGAAFVLAAIYPPYQICLAYLFVALMAGLLWREREALRFASLLRHRLAILVVAVLLIVLVVARYLYESWSLIEIMRHTAYPGQRMLHGGDLRWPHILGSLFTIFGSETLQSAFENLCEGATFYFLSPLVVAYVLWEWRACHRRPEPIVLMVSICVLSLVLFALVGAPEVLARWTGLSRVPGIRTVIASGVGDLVLLVLFLSQETTDRSRTGMLVAVGLAGLWMACVLGAGAQLQPMPSPMRFVAVGVVLVVAGAALLRRASAFLGVMAVLTVASTIWFNPIVRGGTGYLTGNPLSQMITDLDRASGGKSKWIVCDDRWLANLLRILGVRAVNGVHYYPLLNLWSNVDPAGQARDAYNRYANVEFQVWAERGKLYLSAPHPDRVQVLFFPSGDVLQALGAEYVLCGGGQAQVLRSIEELEEVGSLDDRYVFRVR